MACALIDGLQEVLSGGLKQQDLVVVVAVVRKVATLFAHQFRMQRAEGHEPLVVVRAHVGLVTLLLVSRLVTFAALRQLDIRKLVILHGQFVLHEAGGDWWLSSLFCLLDIVYWRVLWWRVIVLLFLLHLVSLHLLVDVGVKVLV